MDLLYTFDEPAGEDFVSNLPEFNHTNDAPDPSDLARFEDEGGCAACIDGAVDEDLSERPTNEGR